jgi:hypothetical protein
MAVIDFPEATLAANPFYAADSTRSRQLAAIVDAARQDGAPTGVVYAELAAIWRILDAEEIGHLWRRRERMFAQEMRG